MAAGIAPPFSPTVKGGQIQSIQLNPLLQHALQEIHRGIAGIACALMVLVLRQGTEGVSLSVQSFEGTECVPEYFTRAEGLQESRSAAGGEGGGTVMSRRIPRRLDPVEIRVLGSLLAKEQTTPEA